MRILALLALTALCAIAQDQPPAAAAPAEAKPAAAPAPETPPPSTPEWVTGTLDFGYRFRTDVNGSLDTYRSVVNLGSGPKLFGVDLNFIDPTKKFFDKLSVSGIGWGGDPYTTARVEASKQRRYRLLFDYRNIVYFDAMPSFANPLAAQGIYLNQRSYDSHRRMADFSLEGRPGSSLVPYFEFSRNSEHGNGLTDFVSDANEYPVANFLNSHTDSYRGGLRIEKKHFHVTLEEGANLFTDDERVTDASKITGNLTNTFVGQNLYLGSLLQSYGISGTTPYSRVMVTATPFSWLDLYGQFQFSQGRTDVNYTQTDSGSLVVQNALLFYNSEQDLVAGVAKQPHTSGSAGFEIRPFKRLRILENYSTDRLHTASSDSLTQALITASGTLPTTTTPAADRLVDNYNQHSLDVILDLKWGLTLRGGERYVWGDTTVRAPFAGGVESSTLSRQSGVAGINWRTKKRLSAGFDFEGGSSNHAYYRTSLQDYRKYRARARYQVRNSLALNWNFSRLENSNPVPSVQYTFSSERNGLSVQWTPQGRAKRITLLGEYARTSVESNILYIVPQFFQSAQSLYRENAHQATGQLELILPKIQGRAGRLTLGGSLFSGSGSQPTHFYQPQMKLSLPVIKRADWVSEWRWYGFDEPFYLYEAFHTTTLTTGFRWKL
ncbi:MAG TPA: hypothetical protein VGN17_18320 [Bryobacteraceae bacterium]|jgi:hypothetical protein